MLAQLKSVVLIKEAIKLAFRLVEDLEHQHLGVQLQAQNGQKQITFFWNSSVNSCSEKLTFQRYWFQFGTLPSHVQLERWRMERKNILRNI